MHAHTGSTENVMICVNKDKSYEMYRSLYKNSKTQCMFTSIIVSCPNSVYPDFEKMNAISMLDLIGGSCLALIEIWLKLNGMWEGAPQG